MYLVRDAAENWNKFAFYEAFEKINDSSNNNYFYKDWNRFPFYNTSEKRVVNDLTEVELQSTSYVENVIVYEKFLVIDTTIDLQNSEYITDADLLKYSVYNLLKTYPNGETVIYNSASDAVLILNRSEKIEFDLLLSKDDKSINRTLLYYLYRLGVLVLKNEDELFKFIFIRNRATYSNSVQKTFLIFPTHQCNARCSYCIGEGYVNSKTKMSKHTAANVVKFVIDKLQPNDKVVFHWFGGEPLMAIDIIDQIIDNFRNETKNTYFFNSIITSNGSLLNQEIINHAVNNWNLKEIQLTFDGYKNNHNKKKNFYNKNIDQYSKLIENIELLLANNVNVICRLNIDWDNYEDFPSILKDLEVYKDNSKFFLKITTLHIPEQYVDGGNYIHFSEFNSVYRSFFEEMFSRGFYKHINEIIPNKTNSLCTAFNSNYYKINADGYVFRCEQESNDISNVVGNIENGIIHNSNLTKWLNTDLLPECAECSFLPVCQGGCKYYRQRNVPQLSPCLRQKFYLDTLFDLIYQWVK